MDDDQYMEDLFNESGSIPIPVTAPPVRGLSQRLNELQESGCCQKIAWSRSGCVASITRDGRGVNLRAFQRDPSDGRWILGDEVPLPIPMVHDEFPIAHVSWGHLGVDLAVVDTAGRILIFTAEPALDKMRLSRDNFTDQETETGAIVGLHWLPVFPQQAKYHMLWTAERDDDKWQYRTTSHQWKEPHNAIDGGSKAAFVCLTRGGTVRLLFQADGVHWLDATAELEATNSAKDTFTHASFTSDSETSLLLVAHSESGTLRVFRVKINWNIPPNRQRIDPPPTPTLEVIAMKSDEDSSPLGIGPENGDDGLASNQRISQPAQLTHLTFVPPSPEASFNNSESHAMVLAVFCHTPAAAPSLVDQTQTQQQQFSILARWELHETKNSLHSSFEQLTAKKRALSAAGQRQSLHLKRQPDIVMNAVTLGLWALDFHTKFALFQSNGSIEFRDRHSLERITADFNENRVSSLVQAGFDFPKHDPALHLSLSPCGCVAASVQFDGTIALKCMEYGLGSLNSGDSDPKSTAAIAALTLQYSSASLQYSNTDDLFAIMPQTIDPELACNFLVGIHHSTNVTADHTAEDHPQKTLHQLFSNSLLRGSLSVQNLLGIAANGHKTLPAKLAWVSLNLRLITWNLTMAARTKSEAALTQEVAKAITGPLKWITDLMVYIVDGLAKLAAECEGKWTDRAFIQEKVRAMNCPALLLLLCSYPRALLRVTRGPLQALLSASNIQVRFAPTVLHRSIFNNLLATVINSPVPPPQIAYIVQEVDQAVRKAYAAAQFTNEQRRDTEREMLIKAEIPQVLMPAVTKVLTNVIEKVLDTVNVANVMFHDLRWLDLHEDSRTKDWMQHNTVDVLRKVVLTEEGKRRRCTRCGSIMEDLDSWLGMPQNKCACAGAWSQLPKKTEERI